MNTLQSIEIFVGINLLLIGLSHSIRSQAWVSFFEFLSKRGEAGNIFNAMLSLGMGSIIVAFHWTWEGPMIIVTVYGLLLTIKGGLYLAVPGFGLKAISGKQVKNANFIIVGVIMIAISLYIFYFSFHHI